MDARRDRADEGGNAGMNKDILFRGKCINRGEFLGRMVYGDLIQKNGKFYIAPHVNSVKVDGNIGRLLIMHEIDPNTAAQFTKIRDSKGNKIFQGDIIRTTIAGDIYEDVVKWSESDAAWKFESTHGTCTVLWNDIEDGKPEIIGNVWDNPELMRSSGALLSLNRANGL